MKLTDDVKKRIDEYLARDWSPEQHERIAKALECSTYFAKQYHTWERDQNENANGLLRQYFSKDIELNDVTISKVSLVIDKLNSRTRKCLNYKTPYEAFFELTGIDAKNLPIFCRRE